MRPINWFAVFVLLCLSVTSISAQQRPVIEKDHQLSFIEREDISLVNLTTYKRALAQDVARNLACENFREILASRIKADSASTPLVTLLRDYAEIWPDEENLRLVELAARLDTGLRRVKGIENRLSELLEVRLANTTARTAFRRGAYPLVAYVPAGDERTWEYIEAFDMDGNVYQLDVHTPPKRPVLVVGLNAKADMRAGIELLNEKLVEAGLQPDMSRSKINPQATIYTSKLTKIRATDDKEPWAAGAAEMYVMVAGCDPNYSKASIKAVDLPYLDNDGTTYYPNQIVVYWSNYRYNAADLVFYEHDDNTNYSEIVSALISGIGTVLPEYSAIAEVANRIISLMPKSLLSNDDDYADVFYTLERGVYYTDRLGVSSNIRISLAPYTLYQ